MFDRSSTQLFPNSNSKYSGGTVLTPALTILSLENSDIGDYYCTADNNVGRGTGPNIQVQVNCEYLIFLYEFVYVEKQACSEIKLNLTG